MPYVTQHLIRIKFDCLWSMWWNRVLLSSNQTEAAWKTVTAFWRSIYTISPDYFNVKSSNDSLKLPDECDHSHTKQTCRNKTMSIYRTDLSRSTISALLRVEHSFKSVLLNKKWIYTFKLLSIPELVNYIVDIWGSTQGFYAKKMRCNF